jgi:hypothetical protein
MIKEEGGNRGLPIVVSHDVDKEVESQSSNGRKAVDIVERPLA